jgi:ABC-type transport system involved in multi-copper enzyme maturation permease subunit
MGSLLKADINRYMSSVAYRLAAIVSLAAGIKIGVCAYGTYSYGGVVFNYFDIDETYFAVGICTVIAAVAFVIGQEYSDRTVRNKLICGYTKGQVYLSELLTAFIAVTLLYAALVIPFALFGIKAMKFFPAEDIVLILAVIYCVYLCVTAMCVMLCSLIKKRAISLILCIGIFVGLFLGASSIDSALEQPEYYTMYDSQDVLIGTEKNTSYIENKTVKKVLRTLYNANPCGQIMGFVDYLSHEITMYTDEGRRTLETYPLYACGLSAIISTVGIAVYKKQDLK